MCGDLQRSLRPATPSHEDFPAHEREPGERCGDQEPTRGFRDPAGLPEEKIVHDHDIDACTVVRTDGRVAGRDPYPRDGGAFGERHTQEGEALIANGALWNEKRAQRSVVEAEEFERSRVCEIDVGENCTESAYCRGLRATGHEKQHVQYVAAERGEKPRRAERAKGGRIGRIEMPNSGLGWPLIWNPVPGVTNTEPRLLKAVIGDVNVVAGAAAPPPSQVIRAAIARGDAAASELHAGVRRHALTGTYKPGGEVYGGECKTLRQLLPERKV
jgi:hypothetical protein